MFKLNEILKAVNPASRSKEWGFTGGGVIYGSGDVRIESISIDSRTIKKGDAFIAIKGNNFDGHDFIDEAIRKGAACIIGAREAKKYAIRNTQYAIQKVVFIEVADTIKALGDIAAYYRRKFNIPVIAVTGSAGKTTVKDMIAHILSTQFKMLKTEGTKNNHIGLPLSLLKIDSGFDMAVFELGTNHPGEIGYLSSLCRPDIGVITNIGPAHLEYFRDLKGVFKEKYTLAENLKGPKIIVLNGDDTFLKKKAVKKTPGSVIFSFCIENKGDFTAQGIKLMSSGLEFYVNGSEKRKRQGRKFKLNTVGYNNIYNALSAIAVTRIFGLDYEKISRSLSDFNFPKGRLNFVKSGNVTFIDDTYNSNPLSLKQALNALDNLAAKGRKIFVMGDMLELGSLQDFFHSQAGKLVVEVCDTLITVGEFSRAAAKAAGELGFDTRNIFMCSSHEEARDVLFNKISPDKDDIVLVKGSRAMKMEKIINYTENSSSEH